MRHELKYLVSQKQLMYLGTILNNLLEVDSHQGMNGYTIRSLYFDSEDDRYLNESINGVNKRNKYRIRIYDGSDKTVNFEKKITIGNLKDKSSSRINRDIVESIIQGDNIETDDEGVLKEVLLLRKTIRLQPKCIVEYDRFAYVSDIGNIRITFDRNLRTSTRVNEFFEDPLMIPIMDNDLHILEVKYDGILPGYLVRFINELNPERTSVSKYALCRQYIDNNGGNLL